MMFGTAGLDWAGVSEFLTMTGARGGLLLVAIAGLAFVLRAASASARHLVWAVGLAALLALPILSLTAPGWTIALPDLGPLGRQTVAAPTAAAPNAGSQSAAVPSVGVAQARRAVGANESDGASAGTRSTAVSGANARAAVAPVARAVGPARAAGPAPMARSTVTQGVASRASARASATGSSRRSLWAGIEPWALLVGIWAIGVVILLSNIGRGHLAIARIGARARPLRDARMLLELEDLAALLAVRRPVHLLEGASDQMPVSWGILRATILLPDDACQWPVARLRSVLLHELAHVRRRDCLTQLVAEIACGLHWPNPLVWFAAWRLRIEREHACDDMVLATGARPSAYAGELVSLARRAGPAGSASLAAVAMARPSTLESRVRAVLAVGRARTLSRRGVAMISVAGVMLATAVAGLSALPAEDAARTEPATAADIATTGVATEDIATGAVSAGRISLTQARSCGTEPADWQSSRHMRNNDRTTISWSRPGCSVEIWIEGDIEFNATFDDIAGLSSNGFLRIDEDDAGTERRLEVRPGSGGSPQFAYRRDGSDAPFDAEARAWYEAMLVQVFRRTGYMATERVAAILESGGVPALFQEIALLDSDHVHALYVTEAIRQADLDDALYQRILDDAAQRVGSDHYLAEILGAVASATDLTDARLDAFIDASRTLDSDHYRAEILGTALARGELDADQVGALLGSALEIDSDHYLAEILGGVADRYAIEPGMRQAYLEAVRSINSDHYATEVLSDLLARSDLSESELATVLQAARDIESDHYVTAVLSQVAERGVGAGALQDAYLEVASDISSDHYRQVALMAFMSAAGELPAGQQQRLIETASDISSDHYLADLLVEIADRYQLSGGPRAAFMDAMESISSRSYRGEVAEALLRNGGG